MKTRVLTAIIFGAVMLTGMLINQYTAITLFAIITIGCLWEYMTLSLHNQPEYIRRFYTNAGVTMGFIPYILSCGILYQPLDISKVFVLILTLTLAILIISLFFQAAQPFTLFGFITGAIFYIGIPFAIVPQLVVQNATFQSHILLGLMLMTWANDSGAYLVGSRIGKHKLFERISPKKTWEGFFGGAIFSLIVATIMHLCTQTFFGTTWIIAGLMVAVFGTLGDLAESLFKRSLHIKDSGSFLPGHGGFLDRFDAFIFVLATAGMYLLLQAKL
ncbi:MAG: phosphatidate cytidylyltransferase [Saprospiraceae bacterium]|nr:phosphatidate cytidylyltransferase [Saprospiraceae bacterium]